MGKMLSPYIAALCKADYEPTPKLAHWCPACEQTHTFSCEEPLPNGAQWRWNGDVILPTFSPSMNIRCGPFPDDGRVEVCHYVLKDGRIAYLADCTHELAGQTVPLPPIPSDVRGRIRLRGAG